MRKPNDHYDAVNALDLRTYDNVLLVDYNIDDVEGYVGDVVRTDSFEILSSKYSKIFVNSPVIDENNIKNIIEKNDGLLSFFADDQKEEKRVRKLLLKNSPHADVWNIRTITGDFVVTNAKSVWEFDNA